MLIVITPEKDVTDEIPTIIKLFENGLETLHLRKPGADKQSMQTYLDQVPKEHHQRIVIHSNYDLLDKYALKGIHITSQTKEWFDVLATSPEDQASALFVAVFKQMIEGKTVSISCHSTAEIDELHYQFDYVFLSPVFDSISKQGYQSKFTADELKQFLPLRKTKVIALGGINKQTIGLCKENGFAGCAALGTVWNGNSVEERLDRFKEIFEN